jgi:hypothetical protein
LEHQNKALHTLGIPWKAPLIYWLIKTVKKLQFFWNTFVYRCGRDWFSSKAASMTQEQLAGILFHSLRDKMTLPDDVIVYPAHGAGSACGKKHE